MFLFFFSSSLTTFECSNFKVSRSFSAHWRSWVILFFSRTRASLFERSSSMKCLSCVTWASNLLFSSTKLSNSLWILPMFKLDSPSFRFNSSFRSLALLSWDSVSFSRSFKTAISPRAEATLDALSRATFSSSSSFFRASSIPANLETLSASFSFHILVCQYEKTLQIFHREVSGAQCW